MLYASLNDLLGDGTITTVGRVLDVDLNLDPAYSSPATFAFGTGGTLTLDFDGSTPIGAGYKSTGSLTVTDGVRLESAGAYLGYTGGAVGDASVTGAGSTWDGQNMRIGGRGHGQHHRLRRRHGHQHLGTPG